jgi:hypothetical protein
MSTRSRKNPLRRFHQLNGPGGISQQFAFGQQPNFKMDDLPQTIVALGRKHAVYVPKLRIHYRGTLTNPGITDLLIARKFLTPMLCSSVQIQGTELGSPVSSTHSLGGLLDLDQYVRNGGKFNTAMANGNGALTVSAGATIAFHHFIDVFCGSNPAQHEGHHTYPLAIFLRPGEILINLPASFASVDASLTALEANLSITCHAVLDPDTELRIAHPWQMTRHKANAGNGSDSVQLNSFGASSTLTGVQGFAGVHGLLWLSNELVGDSAGSGRVDSITQFSADFLGIRQSNDVRAQINELLEAYQSSGGVDQGDVSGVYPLLIGADNAALPASDILAAATVFPVITPIPDFDASKLLDAAGQPSYDITGVFTGNHYSVLWGCYPLSDAKQADLLAIIQRSHIGQEMFGTDDLELMTKLAKKNDPAEIAAYNPKKFTYLPKKVAPKAKAAL